MERSEALLERWSSTQVTQRSLSTQERNLVLFEKYGAHPGIANSLVPKRESPETTLGSETLVPLETQATWEAVF